MTNSAEIHIIVAMNRERLIGDHNKLPWNLPEDLELFKSLTTGNTVIMGSNTFASIGKALPNRSNIVITSRSIADESVESFASFDEGIRYAVDIGNEIYCIGGREIYRAALPMATHLHISWVDGDFSGDIYFPEFDLDNWQEIETCCYDGFTHVIYKRKKGQK